MRFLKCANILASLSSFKVHSEYVQNRTQMPLKSYLTTVQVEVYTYSIILGLSISIVCSRQPLSQTDCHPVKQTITQPNKLLYSQTDSYSVKQTATQPNRLSPS